MAVTMAVARATTPSTTGTVDLTASGFGTPTGAIFYLIHGDTDGTLRESHAYVSIGFTDGTNDRCCSIQIEDGQATTDTRRRLNTALVAGAQIHNSYNSQGAFNSWITDGVRVDWTVNSGSDQHTLIAVLIKGTTDLEVGTFSPHATQNSSASLTGMTAAPEVAFFSTVGGDVGAGNLNSALLSWGVALKNGASTDQRWLSMDNLDALAAVEQDAILHESRCVGQSQTSINWSGEITAWNADGWTMTTRDGGPSGDECIYITFDLAGATAEVATLTTSTSTGVVKTSTTNQPKVLIGALCDRSAVDTPASTDGFCWFACDPSNRYCTGFGDDDTASTSQTWNLTDQHIINLHYVTGGTVTQLVKADFDSFDPDGFNLDYTTADATARKGWYFVLTLETRHYYKPFVTVNPLLRR